MLERESERIDHYSQEPLHAQLTSIFKRNVLMDRWTPGEKIPNQEELCRIFDVSLAVVRQAVDKLVAEGFLIKRQGKGTFVIDPRIRQGPRKLTSFTQELKAKGSSPGTVVLDKGMEKASSKLAKIFEISTGDEVVRIKRLRLIDGEPLGIQTFFCPKALVPDLLSQDLTQSLYELVEKRYGLRIITADERYASIIIDEDLCGLLKVRNPYAGFHVERITRDIKGDAVEYTESIIRGDRYSVQVHLRK